MLYAQGVVYHSRFVVQCCLIAVILVILGVVGVLGVVVFGGNFMMVSLCVVWFVWLCVYVVCWLQ